VSHLTQERTVVECHQTRTPERTVVCLTLTLERMPEFLILTQKHPTPVV
jgi:hypothetical protein